MPELAAALTLPYMDAKMLTKLAAALKTEADRQGLSARQIARRSAGGITQQHVSKIFGGVARDPALGTVLVILGVLRKNLAWLHKQGITPPRHSAD